MFIPNTHHSLTAQSFVILGIAMTWLLNASVVKAQDKPAKLTVDQPQPRVFSDKEGAKLPYLLLIPKDYDTRKHYPLVMFYHGAGERGDDNHSQWRNGVEVFLRPENREKFPCFVIAAQCPR